MSELDVNPAAESAKAAKAAPLVRDEHQEAHFTRAIEQQTARIPSHYFLMAAMAAIAGSMALEVTGRSRWSRFVGMWAPTLLITGVYNKLVKALGPR